MSGVYVQIVEEGNAPLHQNKLMELEGARLYGKLKIPKHSQVNQLSCLKTASHYFSFFLK